ncbi:MAG: hypothetical protein J5786_00055 [Clostridiales bacterium]|nr:hypothetical protein [Clostridiales bacterium]
MAKNNKILKDVGLYVVCNDHNIIRDVNKLLGREGILCIRDYSGHTSYMIDARYEPKQAASFIKDMILDNAKNNGEMLLSQDFDFIAKTIFEEYGFDSCLIGTRIINWSVKNIVFLDKALPLTMKALYQEASKCFNMTTEQVERDIRYTVRKSKLYGIKTINIIGILTERVKRDYTKELK